MELNKIQQVYLVGIGGIGMSGLARYFHHRGCVVKGYDKISTPLTIALEQEGMEITYQDAVEQLPFDFHEPDEFKLVIYTPAIPYNSVILNFLRQQKFDIQKRSQVLGIISKGMFTIAVAGTHGKTTTSSIIAHMLKSSGIDCSAFLGGIASNYQTNMLFGSNNMVVVEADEYDRSFLTLHPDIAVITSMDADHLDIYGDAAQLNHSFQLFAGQLKEDGKLIHKQSLPLTGGTTYAIEQNADAVAENIHIENGNFIFDFRNKKISIKNIELGIAGLHNIENAVAAIQVGLFLEIAPDAIHHALTSFRGVKRRFEYILKSSSHIYIDDYAHHPQELKACIGSIKKLFPGKKLTTIFQPHLYTRTRDFANGFAEALDMTDELLLLDIYPARELPIDGVSAEMLLGKMRLEQKQVIGKQGAIDWVLENKPELLLTVGAGDIDQLVEPLRQALEMRKKNHRLLD
ncbi:MAG: UDP-N-acetylmuramate--L-alanine ligase [Sphingobacteriaceae bacterium]